MSLRLKRAGGNDEPAPRPHTGIESTCSFVLPCASDYLVLPAHCQGPEGGCQQAFEPEARSFDWRACSIIAQHLRTKHNTYGEQITVVHGGRQRRASPAVANLRKDQLGRLRQRGLPLGFHGQCMEVGIHP